MVTTGLQDYTVSVTQRASRAGRIDPQSIYTTDAKSIGSFFFNDPC